MPTNIFPNTQDEYFAFQTKVEVPLYTGGRTSNSIDAAEHGASAAERDVDRRRQELKMHVAELYAAVLRAEREGQVARSQVRSLKAHARDAESRFKRNCASRSDLLAAQVALSEAEYQAIRVAAQLDGACAAYNRQLGRPLDDEVRLAPLSAETGALDLEDLTVRALQQRPEIDRIEAQIAQLDYQAGSVLAANRPQVGLQGTYNFQENQFQFPEGIASVGVGVSWSPLDGGRTRHRAGALQQQAQAMRWRLEDLKSHIRLQVRQAWLDIQQTRRRLQVTQHALERAEENLRVTRRRYSVGAATNTEVLDAESLRTRIYQDHYNAIYDAVLARLRVHRAAGQL